MEPEIQAREFKLERALRFMVYTIAVGLVVLFAAVWFISTTLEQEPLPLWRVLLFTGLVFGAAIACVLVNVYRLRTDERGVHVRTLLGWDSWTWEEFGSGTVEQDMLSTAFVNPTRPLLRRKLRLGFFEDCTDILGIIGAHWQPPPVETPETLQISSFAFPFRRLRLGLSEHGIDVTDRKGSRAYPWSSLTEAILHYSTLHHQRFRKAVLVFPDETISFGSLEGDAKKAWKGADAEVIEAFLRRHVDGRLIWRRTYHGQPADLVDLEERHKDITKRVRGLPIISLMPAMALLSIVFLSVKTLEIEQAKPMLLCAAAVAVPLSVFCYRLGRRDWRRQMEQLEAWREQLEKAETEGEHVTDDEQFRD